MAMRMDGLSRPPREKTSKRETQRETILSPSPHRGGGRRQRREPINLCNYESFNRQRTRREHSRKVIARRLSSRVQMGEGNCLSSRNSPQTKRNRRRTNRKGGDRRSSRRTLPTSERYLSGSRNSERNPRFDSLQRRSPERQQMAHRPRLERVDIGRENESGRPRHSDMERYEYPPVRI